MMTDDARSALADFVIALGDDALVLGHRLSEWCGVGPTLEEDIALSNIALDLIGRADALLTLGGELEGGGRSSDDLAYWRDAMDYRNVAMVELPRGDFAFTMIRQFLFDAMALPLNEWLAVHSAVSGGSTGDSTGDSGGGVLPGIAAKAAKETRYHIRHSAEWVRRLGRGTDESHARSQTAVDQLWMYTDELFDFGPHAALLGEAGLVPPPNEIRQQWTTTVDDVFAKSGLVVPSGKDAVKYFFSGARVGRHTEYLGRMLAEMQVLPRSHPGAQW